MRPRAARRSCFADGETAKATSTPGANALCQRTIADSAACFAGVFTHRPPTGCAFSAAAVPSGFSSSARL